MNTQGSPSNQSQTPGAKPPVSQNTVMAILSYIGPLVIVSYMLAKDEPFVKFHVKQGLLLFIGWVVLWILSGMFFWNFFFIVQLLNLALLIYAIIGIVNAASGKESELPFIGSLARHLPV